MKCEKCKAEFAVKEQAKAKGCCPSCGAKLTAVDYCGDIKAWLWYQYRSPMPLSVWLGYAYLFGGGGMALMMVMAADSGMWTVTNPAGWLSVIAAALVFLLPFFVLFFMPSARKWRAKCREDAVVFTAAVKSGKLSLRKCRTIVRVICLGVTLFSLLCLYLLYEQAMTRRYNQHGQAAVTATRAGSD